MTDTSQFKGDILLAHTYRLSLNSIPTQSSFRVISVIFFETTARTIEHVVGTNDEPCHISGSICAERSAMVQLRFLPVSKITKIIIASDAPHEITPGLQCREYLASSSKVPWDTPIVLSGSQCKFCGQKFSLNYSHKCSVAESCDYARVVTSVAELYPHPSLFVRFTSKEAVKFGGQFYKAKKRPAHDQKDGVEKDQETMVVQKAVQASKYDSRVDLHPVQYGACVMYSDGSTSVAHEKKAIEYGCTLDAVTQLAPYIDEKCTASDKRVRPVLLVQADQYGICHAPFAQGRAFLSEHGYGDCMVLLHDENKKLIQVRVSALVPMTPKLDGGVLLN